MNPAETLTFPLALTMLKLRILAHTAYHCCATRLVLGPTRRANLRAGGASGRRPAIRDVLHGRRRRRWTPSTAPTRRARAKRRRLSHFMSNSVTRVMQTEASIKRRPTQSKASTSPAARQTALRHSHESCRCGRSAKAKLTADSRVWGWSQRTSSLEELMRWAPGMPGCWSGALDLHQPQPEV